MSIAKPRITEAQREILKEMRTWQLVVPAKGRASAGFEDVRLVTVKRLLDKGLIVLRSDHDGERRYELTLDGRWAIDDGMNYEPPFGGSRPQQIEDFERIHPRWVGWLKEHLPEGVPLEETRQHCTVCGAADTIHASFKPECPMPSTQTSAPWPQTFGTAGENGQDATYDEYGSCLQCGGCRRYIPLEGSIGADWGACTHPESQYDGRVVFEHWTCPKFEY